LKFKQKKVNKMPVFGNAEFIIRAVNKTQAAFAQINQGVGNMEKRFNNFGRGLNRIGGLMATAFVGKQITDTITKFEKLEASLRTVTGSADNAAVAFGFIQEFAATTPFQLEEVTDAFIKLKALGLTPSEEALNSYGNTATAMGKSLNQMIEAVADATTGEFERLKEFGIKSKTQGDQVTFTFQGISTTVGKNADEIEQYLRNIGDVQFAGAMQEQAGTLNVALSNMGDAFSKLVKAIGDAGLTDILMAIANSVKWLADKITEYIPLFGLGFKKIVAEIIKFGNYVIEIFTGIGDAFTAFFENIGDKFEAFGKDMANFIANPLEGVSFENTSKALENGLVDSMDKAFNAAIARAKQFNSDLDDELYSSAQKIIDKTSKKTKSLGDLFEKKTAEKPAKDSPASKASKKVATEAKTASDVVKDEFTGLGETIESTMANSLNAIDGNFKSFGDIAKGFLSDLNKSLLQFALKDLGITGEGGIISSLFSGIGGLFGGGGKSSAGGIGGLFSGITSMFGGGKTGGASGGGFGSVLSSAASLFGGFFADGGKLAPGKWGIAGENGPEPIFAGNAPLNILPNQSLAGGGSPVMVTMNIQTPDVRSFRQSQNQIAADMARTIERARRNL
jgi:hypothetical protein